MKEFYLPERRTKHHQNWFPQKIVEKAKKRKTISSVKKKLTLESLQSDESSSVASEELLKPNVKINPI